MTSALHTFFSVSRVFPQNVSQRREAALTKNINSRSICTSCASQSVLASILFAEQQRSTVYECNFRLYDYD